MEYTPSQIEEKWQKIWEEENAYAASSDYTKPKFYGLIEFPYPSGAGLHVGHPRSYVAIDIISRKRRMEGYNVLFPIGWDAFGLPAENYAIKNKIHPSIITQQNIARYRKQLKMLGFSFDYSREVDTTDPNYYKWTQWIFLKFFEKGLAYKAEMPINWCTSCKVGLANEEVVDGVCERCHGTVVKKVKSQWMLRITDYAEKLINGLDTIDFAEKIKAQQRNWIGRSEGAEVVFKIAGFDEQLKVFTTRPDTLFGATYMVLSPEHPLIDKLSSSITNIEDVMKYRKESATKSELERTALAKDKTGVCLKGLSAINPVTNKEIPLWVSDYVLMSYGTGAIMAVPAHDERDWEFAKTFGLPIIEVVSGGDVEKEPFTNIDKGVMVNSGFLNGMSVEEAKKAIIADLAEKGIGEKKVNYKLRDWVFTRQRFWGEPIPLIYCEHCGWVPVPESELPVTLPETEHYMPTDNGESPLSLIEDWVNTTCPKCGKPAKRETDTMPQWAGSSWYYLRYIDPHNDKEFASQEALKYWLPVDWYNGGMEHTTLHLLYSRFWHLFLYDCGLVPTPEPYQKRTSQGMILGANNEKMSKSRGNVVNPDDIVNELGADAFRMYEMFIGAFDQTVPWSMQSARGCRRFLERVWRLTELVTDEEGISKQLSSSVNFAIKKVGEDYERMKYNTAIAAMMTLVNDMYAAGKVSRGDLKALLLILCPVTPHICEEMWELLGYGGRLYQQSWPQYDESALIADEIELAVQINGKIRDRITVASEASEDEIKDAALNNPSIQKQIDGKAVKKIIVIKGKIVNIVV